MGMGEEALLLKLREFDEISRCGYKSEQPPKSPKMGDFEREILSESPPKLGGRSAEERSGKTPSNSR